LKTFELVAEIQVARLTDFAKVAALEAELQGRAGTLDMVIPGYPALNNPSKTSQAETRRDRRDATAASGLVRVHTPQRSQSPRTHPEYAHRVPAHIFPGFAEHHGRLETPRSVSGVDIELKA
jgi:hypothetical protein